MQNFRVILWHLQKVSDIWILIHSGKKEIILDSDIILSGKEASEYSGGIKLDVNDIIIKEMARLLMHAAKREYSFAQVRI